MHRIPGIYPTHRPLPVSLAGAQARRPHRSLPVDVSGLNNVEPAVFSRLVTALCITAVLVVAGVLALA